MEMLNNICYIRYNFREKPAALIAFFGGIKEVLRLKHFLIIYMVLRYCNG